MFIHNYPLGPAPSIADLKELLNHKNAVGITIGHTGNIYYYSKPNGELEKRDWAVALRKTEEYTGNVKEEKAMEELAKNFGFEFKIL